MATQLYEPSSRYSPFFTSTNGKIYMWGGCTKEFCKKEVRITSIEIFDCYLETWTSMGTKGDLPPWLCFDSSASSGHHIYTYGGYDGQADQGALYTFNTKTLLWTKLASYSTESPMRKSACGMVVYKNELVVFGGYGIPSASIQPGSQFVPSLVQCDGSGWTNEMHLFDLDAGKWSSPSLSGTRPPPCAYFSFTMIGNHHAVLFGGRQHEGRSNDTYIIDFRKMHWSKLATEEGESYPMGRSSHAAVCLGYGGDHPQLLVTGGISSNEKTLSDIWKLDTTSWKWKKLVQDKNLGFLSRSSHCATAVNLSPVLAEVTIFGGECDWSRNKSADERLGVANTTVLRFESQSGTGDWALMDVARNRQRGTTERIREKIVKISQMALNAAGARSAAAAMKDRVIRDLEDRASRAEERAEWQRVDYENQLEAMERCLDVSKQKTVEYFERAVNAEKSLEEYEERSLEYDSQWEVKIDEVHMSGPELGSGRWTTVNIAAFRRVQVASKSIHCEISSSQNLLLFKHEMSVAAKLRHPNLVQFIGATTEGEIVILLELMHLSLRSELQKEYMVPSQVVSIGLDMARALNYLHLMQPKPIIHRNVNSNNVFLEPVSFKKWRAKLSDHISSNLLYKLQTDYQANPAYSAPEANRLSQQSPEMDIFSFGALLLEMLTGEVPIKEERGRLIRAVHHRPLVCLIRKCLGEKRKDRPNAGEIIFELEAHEA